MVERLESKRSALWNSTKSLEAENFILQKLLKEAPRVWETEIVEVPVCVRPRYVNNVVSHPFYAGGRSQEASGFTYPSKK